MTILPIQKKIFAEDYGDFFDYLSDFIDHNREAKRDDNFGHLWQIKLSPKDYEKAFQTVRELRHKAKHNIIRNCGFKVEDKEDGDKKDQFVLTYLKNTIEVKLNPWKKPRNFKKNK